MRYLFLSALLFGCATSDLDIYVPPSADPVVYDGDTLCDTAEDTELDLSDTIDGEIGQARQALATYPLGFYRYATSGGRTRGELFEMMECAIVRIRAATGLMHLDFDMEGPNYIRWQLASELAPSNALAISPWSAARIQMSDSTSYDAEGICTTLVHEIFHVLRRSGSHPGPDGSLSYPVTHLISEPHSKITAWDINAVCAVQAGCTLNVPE